MKILPVFFLLLIQIVFLSPAHANGPCVDTDGDGWGWNGSASCIVSGGAQDFTGAPNNRSSNSGACVDSDGDGWGWNGTSSCIPGGSTRALATTGSNGSSGSGVCVDSDGDGWGWDGSASCLVSGSSQNLTRSLNAPEPVTRSIGGSSTQPGHRAGDVGRCDRIENLINNNNDMTAHVTDVILTAGQSNAAGHKTEYRPDLYAEDQIDSRLLAWTSNNRWEVADPSSQTWDLENKQPFFQNRPKQSNNHPAFQIGKAILKKDPCRVVAIIATAATGEPINHWLHNINNHYVGIQSKVSQAVRALPNKSTVDMIWWMQGEADEGLATSSPGTYKTRLNQLINQFRSNSWFSNTGYFLANETRIRYRVNEIIRGLANDGVFYTDYTEGEVLPGQQNVYPSLEDEIRLNVFVHFNDVALRRIGNNVARKYSSHRGF